MTNDSKDIHISENERIQWIEFNDFDNNLIEVDYINGKHSTFWNAFHIFCLPECCGIEAFRFYPEDIKNASKKANIDLLKDDLYNLKKNLLGSSKNIISSDEFNTLIHKSVFIKLLDHIIKYLSL